MVALDLEDTTELVLAHAGGTVDLSAINGKGSTGPQGAPGGSDASFAGFVADTTPSATRQAIFDLRGVANGFAALDSGGKLPVSQLPTSVMEFKGVWNASTNTPTLADGGGDTGDVYRVSVAGTRNLGSGSITFDVGDLVIRNASGVWEKSDTTDAVASVAGKTGIVTLVAADVTDLGTAATKNTGTASGQIPVLNASGRLDIARLASGTPDGTKFVRDDGTLVSVAAGGSLIGYKEYNPGTAATYTWSSGNTDYDTTNLTVTFTVPASGKVILRFQGMLANASAGGQSAYWTARTPGGSNLGFTAVAVASVASILRQDVTFYVTGLTPGASQTVNWGRATSGTGSAFTLYAGGNYGPAIMEVWSA